MGFYRANTQLQMADRLSLRGVSKVANVGWLAARLSTLLQYKRTQACMKAEMLNVCYTTLLRLRSSRVLARSLLSFFLLPIL